MSTIDRKNKKLKKEIKELEDELKNMTNKYIDENIKRKKYQDSYSMMMSHMRPIVRFVNKIDGGK